MKKICILCYFLMESSISEDQFYNKTFNFNDLPKEIEVFLI